MNASNLGTPFKMRRFCYCRPIEQENGCTDLLLIITRTADELSGGTSIDDLERP